MKEKAVLALLQLLPVAYAVVRPCDGQGGAPDFVFLEISDEWIRLTGMQKTAASQTGVAAALPGLEDSGVGWRALFERAQAGECGVLKWSDPTTGLTCHMAAAPVDAQRILVVLQPVWAESRDGLMWGALNSIGDAVALLDGHGAVIGLNRAARELTGWGAQPVEGMPYDQALPLRGADDPVGDAIRTGQAVPLDGRTELTDRQGETVPVVGVLSPLVEIGGRVTGVSMVFRNAAREREQQDAIVYLSYHDHLTGLYNRRFGDEEIRRLDVPRQYPLAVIMGDVNGLKISNDVFGHETGDDILRAAAAAIRQSCREEDIVCRWGGDEFLVLLPRTDAVTAEGIVRRIHARCAQRRVGNLPLSISMGSAAKTRATEDFRHTRQNAEEKMYHQKLAESRKYRNAVLSDMLRSLPEKSCESDDHVMRLKRCCSAMAMAIGLSREGRADLEVLADLHDVGQVAVSREILCKPGPLDAEEWVEVRRHPEIGYRIAHSAMELSAVAESILCHHERWDGRGYPRGLDRENIPVVSRLFAVADAYDAMTHDRPYRPAMARQKAIRELQDCAGTQFDPEMVRVFCRLCNGQTPDFDT